MKYYDIAVCTVPEWYGLKGLRPEHDLVVLKHPDRDAFRRAVEKSLVDAVLPDRLRGHDYFHHKRTLLNNVTAKLMNKNKVSLLFTFKELRDAKGVKRALVWGRMKYEMKLCIKKSVPVIIASGAGSKDDLVEKHTLLAFGELLGLRPEQAKKALNYAQERILERRN